jgi:inhibitor of cysteine peptidase
MPEEIKKETTSKYLWIVLIAVVFLAGIVLLFAKYQKRPGASLPGTGTTKPEEKNTEIKKFTSEQEFQDYIEKSRSISGYYGGRWAGGPGTMEMSAKSDSGLNAPMAAVPSRVSETNVQVAGIDEPDAVKTDGKEIYFSVPRPEIMPMDDTVGRTDESKELFPLQMTGGTKSINAFPPSDLKVDYKIEKSGDLLLVGKMLIVIPTERYYWSQNASKIYGYDVSDPKNPKEIWNIELKESTSIAGARLADGKIYLATKTDFGGEESCLLKPLAVNGAEFSLKCTDIYHPATVVPSDATFTAMIINPATGAIEKNISFLGSNDYNSSVVYMSAEALYLTYYDPGDSVKMLYSFFSENKDLAPDWFVEKLKNLMGYDISSSAKMTEIWELIARFQSSFSSDDRLKMQNEIANRIGDYLKNHRRELDSTGIVKIKTKDLSVDATGSVPGKLLNQFSLDEYKGNLRAATTVGESFLSWGLGFGGNNSSETANDVYILGDSLKTQGSVIDLGKGERIYGVRFIEDKGYVVTFKQVDPFYVLDLTDPMNPVKKGELKIPGYSSYLHPIAKNRILGVGEESGRVKISLFDVSDASDPREIAKYNLDEYYSEISATHHAFLLDAKHQVFFLPGSKGGYIFSYADDNLKLEKAASDIQAKRAIYIDNLLYVIGENKLIVLDENSWEKVKELEL